MPLTSKVFPLASGWPSSFFVSKQPACKYISSSTKQIYSRGGEKKKEAAFLSQPQEAIADGGERDRRSEDEVKMGTFLFLENPNRSIKSSVRRT